MDGCEEGMWRSGSNNTDIRPHGPLRHGTHTHTVNRNQERQISSMFQLTARGRRKVNICIGAHFTARRLWGGWSPISHHQAGSHHCILCLGSESGSSELGSDLHKWLHCPGWGLGAGWIITGWECGDGGHCEKCDDCDDTNTDHSHGTVISWRVLAVSGHIPQSTLKSEQLFQHLKKHNIPWFKFCTDSIFSSVTLVVYLRSGRDTDMMMMRVACHGVRAVPAVPRPGTESINYAETLVARRHKA